jgi:hypothetical protein
MNIKNKPARIGKQAQNPRSLITKPPRRTTQPNGRRFRAVVAAANVITPDDNGLS